MKKAFTLTETLISMTIIAILAAIFLPMINRAKPDTTKVQYIKIYDTVAAISRGLAANYKVFQPISSANYDYRQRALANLEIGEFRDGTTVGPGNSKFCRAVAHELSISVENCSNNFIPNNFNCLDTPAFVNKNNIAFFIQTRPESLRYRTEVYFDINAAEGPNCSISDNCPKPDRFMLVINESGQVVPGDSAGAAYLLARLNWLKKVGDKEVVQFALVPEHINCLTNHIKDAESGLCVCPNWMTDNNDPDGLCMPICAFANGGCNYAD